MAAAASSLAHAQAGQLEQLSWLTGCWASEKGEAGSGEFWLPLAGGTMLGIGRIVRGGRTVDHEFLSLHADPDGRAVYTVRPARQKEVAFVAVDVGADSATFANPAHDFPQRIIYRLMDKDRLVARIEGDRQGQRRAVDFQFRRAACPG